MTSNHHGLYVRGYTRTTMVATEGRQTARWSKSHKSDPSSDCRLQLACMKSESLVIADQQAAVNTFPGLVHTARHTMEVGCNRIPHFQFTISSIIFSGGLKVREKLWSMTGVKS